MQICMEWKASGSTVVSWDESFVVAEFIFMLYQLAISVLIFYSLARDHEGYILSR